MNWIKFLWVTLLSLHPLNAMVLDHSIKKSRPICGAPSQQVTPLQESILRGQCEPFVQGVGKVVVRGTGFVSQGTGVLIAPNVVLTAAHVVNECLSNNVSCSFRIVQQNRGAVGIDSEILISETYIPEPYKDLDARIQVLERERKTLETRKQTENRKILDSKANYPKKEDKSDILDSEMSNLSKEISLYKTNVGNYDIALVKLEGRVELNTYLQIYNGNISDKFSKSSHQVFGVSSQRIKINTTGGYTSEYMKDERHIGVFTMDLDYKESKNPLVASYTLPRDYHSSCKRIESGKSGMYPDRFLYQPETDSFLKSITQPGDSGGPLIAKVSNEYFIVGVAQQVNYKQCVESTTNGLVPGGTFFNLWTPTFNHLSWIAQKLQDIG